VIRIYRLAGFPRDLGSIFDQPSHEFIMDDASATIILYPKIKQAREAKGLSEHKDHHGRRTGSQKDHHCESK
jgi:hypothetical protein